MEKLTSFTHGDKTEGVHYKETQQVKEGVECDIYEFTDDTSKDLGIIRVLKGHKTPLQKVLKGTRTTEGHISGKGVLLVGDVDDTTISYSFPNSETSNEVRIKIGQTMQWQADEDLVFYEICEPPYEEGRFQNLS